MDACTPLRRIFSLFQALASLTLHASFLGCCIQRPDDFLCGLCALARNMSFVARNLGFAYGLEDVSFELPQTGLVAIAGPNGAGKSTPLGILARLRTPYR